MEVARRPRAPGRNHLYQAESAAGIARTGQDAEAVPNRHHGYLRLRARWEKHLRTALSADTILGTMDKRKVPSDPPQLTWYGRSPRGLVASWGSCAYVLQVWVLSLDFAV